MSPPLLGGIGVLSTLGILENFQLGNYPPGNIDLEGGKPAVMGVHLVTEAERLAYADRDKYVADTDFVPLPGGSPDTLLNKTYVQAQPDQPERAAWALPPRATSARRRSASTRRRSKARRTSRSSTRKAMS